MNRNPTLPSRRPRAILIKVAQVGEGRTAGSGPLSAQGGARAGEPITQLGDFERLARACQVVAFRAGLDSTVIETRYNVVRSSVPDMVDTVRRLGDYLPHVDQAGTPARGDVSLVEAAMTVGVWSRAGRAPAASFPPR